MVKNKGVIIIILLIFTGAAILGVVNMNDDAKQNAKHRHDKLEHNRDIKNIQDISDELEKSTQAIEIAQTVDERKRIGNVLKARSKVLNDASKYLDDNNTTDRVLKRLMI